MFHITGLHHVGINVTDMSEALAFYTDVMGLTEIEAQETGPPGTEIKWLLAADGTRVDLIKLPASRDARHLAFAVADFDEAVKELERQGMEIVRGPAERSDGSRFLIFRDINGNLTELAGA